MAKQTVKILKKPFGAKPPRIDIRDYKVCASAAAIEVLPLEYQCDTPQPIKDQGNVNSCVAHAVSSIGEYYTYKDQQKFTPLSTAFPYGIQYSECGQDGVGMYLSDACKILQKYGNMTYDDCPGNYEINQSICRSIAEESLADAEKASRAYSYRIASYYTCNSDSDIKYALYHYGPVLVSVKWHNNYTISRPSGVITFDKRVGYGYHASVIYGWNETGFLCQNSWGDDWGIKGYYVLPYAETGFSVVEAKAMIDYTNGVEAENDEELVKPLPKYADFIIKCINVVLNVLEACKRFWQ